MTIQERSYRKEPQARRGLVVGDFVREVDGDRVGMVVYLMDCGLVVVRWPPSREGIAYGAEDLVSVDDDL
jgi:hypothetical protein